MELVKVIYPKDKTSGLLALGPWQVGQVYEVDGKTAAELFAIGFEPVGDEKKSNTAAASAAGDNSAAGANAKK